MKRLTKILHFGDRVARAVRTTDGQLYAPRPVNDAEIERRIARVLENGRRTQDDRLDAWSDGKVLALGTVWTGSVAPEIDARLDALRPLMTGFTSGRVLHAEPASNSLDMGRRWVGDICDFIRAGARDSERGEGERVDLSDLARSAADLEDALERRDRDRIAPAYDRLRSAYDSLQRRVGDAKRRTADAQIADRGAREARSTRDTIRSMNEANRQLWSGRDVNGTAVPSPASVAPTQARTTRDWAMEMPGGSPFVNGQSLKFGTPRSPTVSEINRRNAEFWAAHNSDDLPPAA